MSEKKKEASIAARNTIETDGPHEMVRPAGDCDESETIIVEPAESEALTVQSEMIVEGESVNNAETTRSGKTRLSRKECQSLIQTRLRETRSL